MIKKPPMPRRTGRAITATEFKTLCESIWGVNWKSAAGRNLGRDPKMMQRYERDICVVPLELEQKLYRIADIGPEAKIIKASLIAFMAWNGTSVRPSLTERAHNFAIETAAKLKREIPHDDKS